MEGDAYKPLTREDLLRRIANLRKLKGLAESDDDKQDLDMKITDLLARLDQMKPVEERISLAKEKVERATDRVERNILAVERAQESLQVARAHEVECRRELEALLAEAAVVTFPESPGPKEELLDMVTLVGKVLEKLVEGPGVKEAAEGAGEDDRALARLALAKIRAVMLREAAETTPQKDQGVATPTKPRAAATQPFRGARDGRDRDRDKRVMDDPYEEEGGQPGRSGGAGRSRSPVVGGSR